MQNEHNKTDKQQINLLNRDICIHVDIRIFEKKMFPYQAKNKNKNTNDKSFANEKNTTFQLNTHFFLRCIIQKLYFNQLRNLE